MDEKKYFLEQFDDIKILRYDVPVFDSLTLKEKLFVYYLSRAALAGRDILWDQNNRYNLRLRKVLEKILRDYKGDLEAQEFQHFLVYAKKVFFANGIHHHYSMEKFIPEFTPEYFKSLLLAVGEEEMYGELERVIFDPDYMAKRVVLDDGKDLVQASANNYYEGVTQKEVEEFYREKKKQNELISWGLNSTLVRDEQGRLREEVWYVGGKYSKELTRVVENLEKAAEYACNEHQKEIIDLLVQYYRTGDLALFDRYSIEWVKESAAPVDFINGFIEVYGDPLAYKASWESVVQIMDEEACKRTRKLADNALWFERNAPIDERFKKSEVVGIIARVVQAAMLGGDCHPATPIGINLPNAEWIRERYGSKSVTLDNITYAYNQTSLTSGVLDEFAYSEEEKELVRKYGYLGGNVHTDLHECLGHGSGKMLPGVGQEALKNYYSTIEETRADLFALYYVMDPKLVELGVIPSLDVAKSEYCNYIRNGLMVQLTRVKLGNNLEESHMRNRQLIASWVYEKGKASNVIERVVRDGKTYFTIRDYDALRQLFGKLLAEIQRVKSEGDFEGARNLIEGYGVRIDPVLHQEVLERYRKLNVAPYAGFVNPEYKLVEKEGNITDVEITYPTDFLAQMLEYGNM
ncbi:MULTISPECIES: dihydrofolate reductase [Butyricimonas]|uniref:dipeptidyl-peptidase 3 family protein n=1 Tax=Butyricimonas TaxID=574697 RepID=UPI000C076EF1|nr:MULTISPECIES: dihydrofolate reductase [Butyricimonas]MCB6971531.1 dipeptidyl peptidase 3 [Butyricimonas synergistica]MCG4518245.1 dipeptidyl peptidase 3 [Butyricimonas sp. DFI.6.44]